MVVGQEDYENLPDLVAEGDGDGLNDFEIVIKKLDMHFLPNVSIILQQYYSGKRKQDAGESVEDFVTALRKLAVLYDFGNNIEVRIQDQFMLECRSSTVRE
ncbi:hypothetical protein NDU88_006566 [Pleurodeles waltl]|uniref:Uncharacterized protein n=1 Tax=Pleurodeles waltl TaxID=8319 RepID=A0AAV7U0I5_PLEWA|nr:hypothetical protein NDU88_006566 [Pleurodeles waltl]